MYFPPAQGSNVGGEPLLWLIQRWHSPESEGGDRGVLWLDIHRNAERGAGLCELSTLPAERFKISMLATRHQEYITYIHEGFLQFWEFFEPYVGISGLCVRCKEDERLREISIPTRTREI